LRITKIWRISRIWSLFKNEENILSSNKNIDIIFRIGKNILDMANIQNMEIIQNRRNILGIEKIQNIKVIQNRENITEMQNM
jgi:hypothetical protein